ncbi:uncharacterized protein ACOB8E_001776 isoform 2-T5 [Sarcophilus harrisii]
MPRFIQLFQKEEDASNNTYLIQKECSELGQPMSSTGSKFCSISTISMPDLFAPPTDFSMEQRSTNLMLPRFPSLSLLWLQGLQAGHPESRKYFSIQRNDHPANKSIQSKDIL